MPNHSQQDPSRSPSQGNNRQLRNSPTQASRARQKTSASPQRDSERKTTNSTSRPSRAQRFSSPPDISDDEPSQEEEIGYIPTYKERKKLTAGRLLWILITLPFRLIAKITRHFNCFVIWPLRILLSLSFVAFVIGIILVFLYGAIANRYDVTEVMKMPERTIVLDRKNREIGRLHGENRTRVHLNEVPPIFIKALLVREDSRFYSHGGVDWIGVGRAVHQVFKHKRATQGASTLTMQLAKTTFNHSKRDLNTKLTEVALAKRIESTYSKDEILEAYINRIFWGHTFMGLSAAARGYFNKRPSELTLSECAMLAGIIYGPNEFSPYKNPKGAKEVRNIVLQSLLDEKAISQEEYTQALNEEIVTHRPESRSEENYAMNLIRRELDIILEDENIRLGGLIVRTTLDLDLQNATIDAINKHLKEIESAKGYKHPTRSQFLALTPEQQKSKTPDYLQAACVAIDNSSGALYVVVGGRDAEESRFNRAVQSRRQVGSLFKPFVYATFFEKGYSASTQVSDGPIRPGEIAGAGRWSPRNSDNSFRGIQPASYGLVKSRNTMSVRVGHMAGLRNVVEHASLAGFQGRISMTPALYLGTWEASPLDIASAYTVFANGGVRPTPYMIETIADSEDQTLFYTRKTTRRVFSRRAAVMTSELLQQVTKPGGTAGKIQSLGFKAPCGGKTGTTNKYMNAWFSGFSSSITACVWVGFDRQRTIINKGYGATLALPIWVDVMKAAQLNGYPCGAIPTNANNHLSSVRLCRESNMIAHTGCIDAHTDYFETMPGIEKPTNMCNKHIPLALPDDEASIPNAIPVGGDVPTAEPVSPENIPLPIPVAEEPDSAPTSSIPVAEPLDEDGEIDENNNAIPIPN